MSGKSKVIRRVTTLLKLATKMSYCARIPCCSQR